MPRKPRTDQPGDLVHARSRFMNEEFRINTPEERALVLRAMGRAARRCDVLILAFAIMSNHIHVAALRQLAPLRAFYQSFHTAIARMLNDLQGRFGPLIAGRPSIDEVPLDRFVHLMMYVHGNQMSAGMAASLGSSDWTSHPVYSGTARPLDWLRTHEAAALAGHSADPAGVAAFAAELEGESVQETRFLPAATGELRRRTRRALGGPVELGTPRHGLDGELEVPVVAPPHTRIASVGPRSVSEVGRLCAAAAGVSVEVMRSPGRGRDQLVARALALRVWGDVLVRPVVEMAAYLGLSESGASRARHRDNGTGRRAATLVRTVVRQLAEADDGEV